MSGLKAGDRFPEGVQFRYALDAALTIAMLFLNLLSLLVAVGYLTLKRKNPSHLADFLRHTMLAKSLQTRK